MLVQAIESVWYSIWEVTMPPGSVLEMSDAAARSLIAIKAAIEVPPGTPLTPRPIAGEVITVSEGSELLEVVAVEPKIAPLDTVPKRGFKP